MAQNDTHVALIILTTQIRGGGGGDYWWKKKLCSCAFGANIRSYTKQHGTPFLQPPPPSFGGRSCHPPPPPPPQSNFQVALVKGVKNLSDTVWLMVFLSRASQGTARQQNRKQKRRAQSEAPVVRNLQSPELDRNHLHSTPATPGV